MILETVVLLLLWQDCCRYFSSNREARTDGQAVVFAYKYNPLLPVLAGGGGPCTNGTEEEFKRSTIGIQSVQLPLSGLQTPFLCYDSYCLLSVLYTSVQNSLLLSLTRTTICKGTNILLLQSPSIFSNNVNKAKLNLFIFLLSSTIIYCHTERKL